MAIPMSKCSQTTRLTHSDIQLNGLQPCQAYSQSLGRYQKKLTLLVIGAAGGRQFSPEARDFDALTGI
jgi:hypothetical protein